MGHDGQKHDGHSGTGWFNKHLLALLMYALIMRQKMDTLRRSLLDNLKHVIEEHAAGRV